MSSKKAAKKAKQRQKKEAEQGRALLFAAGRGDCGAMGKVIDGGLDVNALVENGKTDHLGRPVRATARRGPSRNGWRSAAAPKSAWPAWRWGRTRSRHCP